MSDSVPTSLIKELSLYVLQQACTIQAIPAPSLSESRRASYLKEQFTQLGLLDVEQDEVGNVLARLPGGSGAPLLLTAHMDSVFPEGQALSLNRSESKITGPGIGDNALGVATLLGIGRLGVCHGWRLSGDLWLVATVGEEGHGDLRGMKAIVRRFMDRPVAYLVLEGIGLGRVVHRALAVRRYRIYVRAPGGHPWAVPETPSAIHTLIAVAHEILRLPLPASSRTVLNIGVIQGGVSVNTRAPEAWMDVELRSEEEDSLAAFEEEMQRLLRQYKGWGRGISIELMRMGHRPAGAILSSHPLVQKARQCLARLGVNAALEQASTDANVPLSQGYAAICIGLARGGHAHTPNEYIETESVAIGLQQVVCLLQSLWN
ncbi:M20/M25/M40 family metallo-hydrolase [uncultured Thermanaerothrix sp.]|uniref:M20/M25/M40 family metallo-hydrolase n=1 Tax=uncultured Thermanaerothrix sp. TaxID=1195149 RepID=UPI002602E9A4|nr:M20/M25/M40 family metallo-hydrolase [uncultured Thermanaerothrix sp.]